MSTTDSQTIPPSSFLKGFLQGRPAPADLPVSREDVLGSLNHFIQDVRFKRTLNQILAFQSDTQFKSLAIMSEYPGEGKTFIVSALALAYARFLNSRVLIVDTIDQPESNTLHFQSILGQHLPEGRVSQNSEPGLIDLLSTSNDYPELRQASDFQLGNYIKSVQSRYDIVLFDTCAISAASRMTIDPVILGQFVDYAVLVTSTQSLQKRVLIRVTKTLQSNRVNLLGALFNHGVH